MNYHYTNAENKPVGPVTFAELQRLAREGRITERTNVIAEGSQTWTTWGSLAQAALRHPAPTTEDLSPAHICFGLMLAIIAQFTLPWTIYKKSLKNLAQWGRAGVLPSQESDLPALTFFIVVVKDAAIVLWPIATILLSFLAALAGSRFSLFGQNSGLGNGIASMIGSLFIVYFIQIPLVAIFFEALSLLVRIANDVRSLAKKQPTSSAP